MKCWFAHRDGTLPRGASNSSAHAADRSCRWECCGERGLPVQDRVRDLSGLNMDRCDLTPVNCSTMASPIACGWASSSAANSNEGRRSSGRSTSSGYSASYMSTVATSCPPRAHEKALSSLTFQNMLAAEARQRAPGVLGLGSLEAVVLDGEHAAGDVHDGDAVPVSIVDRNDYLSVRSEVCEDGFSALAEDDSEAGSHAEE